MMTKLSQISILAILIIAPMSAQSEDEIKKTKVNPNFSIFPPITQDTVMQQWNLSGAFQFIDGKLQFHNGQPTQKSVMFNYNPLHYDDYFELHLKAQFDKKISQTANVQKEDQINAFLIQFLPNYPQEAFQNVNNKELISLEGFTIILMTHDSHTDHSQNVQSYFVTYRYFPSATTLNRDYLSVVFDKRENYESCNFDAMRMVTDIRVTIDFENSNSLTFQYKDYQDKWTTCFVVPQIYKYITKNKSFLQLQQTNGKQFTMASEIHEIQLKEKEHRLDVDQSLLVSHHLMEEIFDKVKNFSEIFEEDKDNLLSIVELQNDLVKKAKLLEIYTKDLNKGSKKFQEYMIESLNRHRFVNPQSFPKLVKIKEKIDSLEKKQANIYQRFVNIKGLLQSKQTFKTTYNNFKKIDGLLNQIVQEISSSSFKDFMDKSRKMIAVLKRVDFGQFLDSVDQTIKLQNQTAAQTGTHGIYIVIGICLVVLIFAWLILKNISKAEKSHFS